MNTLPRIGAFLLLAVGLLWSPACKQSNDDYKTKANQAEFLHAGVRRITDIIRYDIFAPPISARIYTYSSIAAYEALVPGFPAYQSLAGQVNGLEPGPQPEAGKDYCFPLASVNAQLTVGKALVFSEGDVESLKETIFESLKQKDLYFIGECLDITGELGGFNFQIAFSEAFVCAKELNKYRPSKDE